MSKKRKDDVTSEQLADVIVKGAQERKGLKIVKMDLRGIPNAVADFFVICHGTSNTHVDALADAIEDEARKELGEKPWHREGTENAEWILIDYVNVVAHVFQKEQRDFYGLEKLWADAHIMEYEENY